MTYLLPVEVLKPQDVYTICMWNTGLAAYEPGVGVTGGGNAPAVCSPASPPDFCIVIDKTL